MAGTDVTKLIYYSEGGVVSKVVNRQGRYNVIVNCINSGTFIMQFTILANLTIVQ